MDLDNRSLLAATPLMAVAGCEKRTDGPTVDSTSTTQPHIPDPNETFVVPHDKMSFEVLGNLPPRSGEMALLYGDFNKQGPYLVMMRWNPGWFSAPTYVCHRSDLRRRVWHLVCQQRERFLARGGSITSPPSAATARGSS